MGAGRRCLAVHLRSHAVDPWVFVSVRPHSFPFTGVRFRWWASAFVGGHSSPSVRGWLRLVLPCKWERGRGGCCLPGCYPSLAILVCPRSSVVGCHVANGDVVPVSCVREGEGGGIFVTHLYMFHSSSLLLSSICYWLPRCPRRRGPCFSCEQKKRERRDSLPEFMWTVMTTCVVTVWTMWHVR